eukprot:21866_1
MAESCELKTKELHPTSSEFLKQFSEDIDYDFLEQIKKIWFDVAALKQTAYDENTNIDQTMICLLRISEINTLDITTRITIILGLQDKTQFENAYGHSTYAIQHWNLTQTELNITENQRMTKILYECHLENLYHLGKYDQVIQTGAQFEAKYACIPIMSSRIFHLLYFANTKLEQWSAASVNITKSILMDPHNATLYNDRCFVSCKQEKYDKALQDANTCIAMQSDHTIALINRGSVYNSLSKYELAISDLDKVIEITNGKSAHAFRHRACSYYELKQYDEAISDINDALFLNNEYVDAQQYKLRMWNDHFECIRYGIGVYCQVYDLMFGISLIHVVTDYVVGCKIFSL